MTFTYRTALIVGGSRGVGRDIARKLADRGVRTVVVARGDEDLSTLRAETATIETIARDAAADGAAEALIARVSPDLLVLAGGHLPKMKSITELTWGEFSANWNSDTKIAFAFTTAALAAPMSEGSAVVSFSSGAAVGGSPLSGGYSGAKKMQHFISNYGQWEADRRGLGLDFVTIYPRQLIEGSDIAKDASSAYAAARSVTPEEYMKQWEKPLTAGLIGDRVIDLLAGGRGSYAGAYAVTGTGMEQLA